MRLLVRLVMLESTQRRIIIIGLTIFVQIVLQIHILHQDHRHVCIQVFLDQTHALQEHMFHLLVSVAMLAPPVHILFLGLRVVPLVKLEAILQLLAYRVV